VASLSVTVAAYGSGDAAVRDFDDVDLSPDDAVNLIDIALIERSDRQVTKLHRYSSSSWAHGEIASALVAVLWPPALLDGALAGGVGKRTLTFLSTGLTRDAVNELGRVMEAGRFVTLAIFDRRLEATRTTYGTRALQVAILPLRGTAYDLRHATEDDRAEW
jgi:hypothetical protein